MRLLRVPLAAAFMIFLPGKAHAALGDIWSYVSQYQFGIDYSNSIDYVALSYETPSSGGISSSCHVLNDDSTKKKCSVGMQAGDSSGFGVFLEKAFKKQGRYYFGWDISAGARYLSGQIHEADISKDGLPLRYASFSLAAFVVKPYIQFGITPDSWPDVLVSMGPAMQVAVGNVTINDKPRNVVVGTSSFTGPMSLLNGFFALEVVLKRFGEGAFSLTASHDFTGNGEGSKIYPGEIDGMSGIRGSFKRDVGGMAYGFGLKLVTPWP